MSYFRSSLAILVAVVLLLVGCFDADSDPAMPIAGETVESRLAATGSLVGNLDEQFLTINSRVRGFAGIWREGGRTVVASTVPPNNTLWDNVMPFVTARWGATPVDVRMVEFEFAELQAWRVKAGTLFSLGSVVWTDVDEVRNVVAVGALAGSDTLDVREWAREQGIPDRAFEIRTVYSRSNLTDLDDHVRPASAGVAIDGSHLSGPCTLGFATYSEDKQSKHFVTASHCTSGYGTDDDDYPYQHSVTTSHRIGLELLDPAWEDSLANCSPGNDCRYSDAAMFSVYPISPPTNHDSIYVGAIARTTDSDSTSAAGITISSSSPFIKITGTEAYPAMGDTLHKMGRTSGWTFGPVNQSCFNYQEIAITDAELLCVYTVESMYATGGDSGAPIFYYDDSSDEATLTGILKGELNGDILVSPLGGIQDDVQREGSPWDDFEFDVIWRDPPTATITGPTEVPSNTTCTWFGSASGGSGTLTYRWFKNGSQDGSGTEYSEWTGTVDFTVVLTVTDDYGLVGADTVEVDVGIGNCMS